MVELALETVTPGLVVVKMGKFKKCIYFQSNYFPNFVKDIPEVVVNYLFVKTILANLVAHVFHSLEAVTFVFVPMVNTDIFVKMVSS